MLRSELASKKDTLLSAFVRCRRITQACADAGVSTGFHYAALRQDQAYKLAFMDAQAEVAESLELEAWRRATGYQERKVERIWDKETGEWSDFKETVTDKASDAILMRLLEANNPDKFSTRTKTELTGKDGAPLGGNPALAGLSNEALDRIEAIIREEAEKNESGAI